MMNNNYTNFWNDIQRPTSLVDTDVDTNASGGTYIYCAFASAPFVTSNGGANNAS